MWYRRLHAMVGNSEQKEANPNSRLSNKVQNFFVGGDLFCFEARQCYVSRKLCWILYQQPVSREI